MVAPSKMDNGFPSRGKTHEEMVAENNHKTASDEKLKTMISSVKIAKDDAARKQFELNTKLQNAHLEVSIGMSRESQGSDKEGVKKFSVFI